MTERERVELALVAARDRLAVARREVLTSASDRASEFARWQVEAEEDLIARLEAHLAKEDEVAARGPIVPLRWAEIGLRSMRETLSQGGSPRNTALFVRQGSPLVTVFFTFGQSRATKDRVAEVLGRFGRSVGADLAVVTADAYVSTVELDPADGSPLTEDEAAKEAALEAGDLRPTEDPAARESLIALGITPGGVGWQAEQVYRRLDDGSLAFDEVMETTPTGGLMPRLIATGLRGRPGAPMPDPKRCLSSLAEVSSPPMVMVLNDEMEALLS